MTAEKFFKTSGKIFVIRLAYLWTQNWFISDNFRGDICDTSKKRKYIYKIISYYPFHSTLSVPFYCRMIKRPQRHRPKCTARNYPVTRNKNEVHTSHYHQISYATFKNIYSITFWNFFRQFRKWYCFKNISLLRSLWIEKFMTGGRGSTHMYLVYTHSGDLSLQSTTSKYCTWK